MEIFYSCCAANAVDSAEKLSEVCRRREIRQGKRRVVSPGDVLPRRAPRVPSSGSSLASSLPAATVVFFGIILEGRNKHTRLQRALL